MGVIKIRHLGYCFAVCDLWLSHFYFCLIFALHALYIDLKMELAHTGNNRLICLMINIGSEGWILLGEPVESFRHIHLGLVVNRNDCQGYDRLRDVHGAHGH